MKSYRLALLGDPVSHSRSPEIHRTMLEMCGFAGEYSALRADQAVLAEALVGLKEGLWHGLNVTMPLKHVAARSADRLTQVAERSLSVNTLFLTHGSVLGDSTDSTAFVEILSSDRFTPDSPLLVLGAGGAAAAALAALDGSRVVYIAARHRERAERLRDALGGEVIDWGTPVVDAVVVNTTPIGMHGEDLPADVLTHAGGLVDLPYGPERTPAVLHSYETGLPVSDGHEFLLRQAIASFALWTGARVGLEELSARLRKV